MKLAVVELEAGHTTVVNIDQITYVREDVYGTAIHFTSGEHIVCPGDIAPLLAKLQNPQKPENLLIQSVR